MLFPTQSLDMCCATIVARSAPQRHTLCHPVRSRVDHGILPLLTKYPRSLGGGGVGAEHRAYLTPATSEQHCAARLGSFSLQDARHLASAHKSPATIMMLPKAATAW